MAEIPRGLVAHAQTPFELVRGNALFGFAHEISGEKPLPKGQMRIMEDRSGSDRELIAALVTVKLTTLLYAGYLLRSAARTLNAVRPLQRRKAIPALILISIYTVR
jgi:hypothetical protein